MIQARNSFKMAQAQFQALWFWSKSERQRPEKFAKSDKPQVKVNMIVHGNGLTIFISQTHTELCPLVTAQ